MAKKVIPGNISEIVSNSKFSGTSKAVANTHYQLADTDAIKTSTAIKALEAQIAVLKQMIDTTQVDNKESFNTVNLLQDAKRIKKQYITEKTRLQQNREAEIKASITNLEAQIRKLKADNDKDFGEKVTKDIVEANRIESVNAANRIATKEKSAYLDIINDFNDKSFDKSRAIDYVNSTFKSSKKDPISVVNSYLVRDPEQYSYGEQKVFQDIITETINVNGFSVRYLPRHSDYHDKIWNEEPESYFHKGFMVDAMLVSATGFQDNIMTQYGIENEEKIEIVVSMDRFTKLDSEYRLTLTDDEVVKFGRMEPTAGDLIIIPFGRSANNRNNYIPKVFQIDTVRDITDDIFFRLGELYQYHINASLFDLSAEDINFAPVVARTTKPKRVEVEEVLVDDDTGSLYYARQSTTNADSEYDLDLPDTDKVYDTFGDNVPIEERSQNRTILNDTGKEIAKSKVLVKDYTSKAFKINKDIISELDDV